VSAKKNKTLSSAARARQAAREEAVRLKAAREAAARKRRVRLAGIGTISVVVVAVLVVVIFKVFAGASDPSTLESRPAGALPDGGIELGQDMVAGAPAASGEDVVTVDIYSDYMCPFCGDLEIAIESKLVELSEAGEIRVVMHPTAQLDGYSTEESQYSTRAANNAATVAALAPEKFFDFHNKLFSDGVQPEENTPGLTDEEMVTYAEEVGVPADVTAKFAEGLYAQWVIDATDRAIRDVGGGTPKVFLTKAGGEPQSWKNWAKGNLDAAVAAVRAGESPDV
jgi:protein-disulfide isomerase